MVICNNAIPCTVTVDGIAGVGVGVFSTTTAGDYTVSGLGAGLHTITAFAAGHEAVTVQASVALNGVGFAPAILLPRLVSLTGTVVSRGPSHFVPDPVATLFDSTSAVVPPCYVSHTVQVKLVSGSVTLFAAASPFTADDVGRPIVGPSIPQGTTIATVTSGKDATLSQAATNASASATLTIGPRITPCATQVRTRTLTATAVTVGAAIIVANTGSFSPSDVGSSVTGGGLPPNTTILAVPDASHAVLSQQVANPYPMNLTIALSPGHFRLDNITHGTYTVAFSATGFLPSTPPTSPPPRAPAVVFAVNQSQSQDFALR